ncbi:MAG: ThiF family adenylyltransferase [Planctomycetes bacterium]|nr:ThiF family adenylyltransferase [Planctomycetota bacterium]
MSKEFERYSKQILFADFDEERQRQLARGRVLLCGCGALGTVLADSLVRAGVGFLRIVDRDFVELSNLQRQVLFDEDDVRNQLPKAVCAAEKLRRINSDVTIEPIVADIDFTNIASLADGVDLILDGTDNFEIRFLINDVSLESSIPWIYAGVIGSHGQTMAIFPHETACLRCLISSVPDPGSTETCDTAGVLGPAVNVISSLAAIDALKILSGQREKISRVLTIIDVWDGTFRRMNVGDLRERSDCPACRHQDRSWLTGKIGSQTTVLCGRNAVQVSPPKGLKIEFDALARKLAETAEVSRNAFLLRFDLRDPDFQVTVFRDGRAIVKGTEDLSVARGIYSRYIGN